MTKGDTMSSGDGASGQVSGLEKFYRDSFVLAIAVSVCCGGVGFVLALITYFTAKDPKAKSNAMICIIIPIVLSAIWVLLYVLGVGAAFMSAQ